MGESKKGPFLRKASACGFFWCQVRFLLVHFLLCIVQLCIHLVNVASAHGKLRHPHDGENQDENPKISKESSQAVFHPVREIRDRHHDDGVD